MVLPARPGDETETVIERIVPGGFGLGFGGGRTLFVSRAAPGDRLRVRIDREHGRVAHASIVEILEPGPDRVAEAYPLLSRCGADFQHLRYDAQLAAKSGMIADSLRRIGGINLPDPIHVAPSPWEYRARAEWRHDPNQPALGYLEAGTRRVVDLPEDPSSSPRLPIGTRNFAPSSTRDGCQSGPPSYGPPLRRRHLVRAAVELPQPLPVHATVAGERYEYDADCFFQVNPFVLDGLMAEALRHAPEVGASPSPCLVWPLTSTVASGCSQFRSRAASPKSSGSKDSRAPPSLQRVTSPLQV